MTTIPNFKFALREDVKDEKQFLPKQSEFAATGWDVRACPLDKQDIVLYPGDYAKIPTGIRAFSPEGWWLKLNPRSSTFAKKNCHALYGVIDQDYNHEILFACQYIPEQNTSGVLKIKYGEAIGQLIPVRREVMLVTEVDNTQFDLLCSSRVSERIGGFGSSGA